MLKESVSYKLVFGQEGQASLEVTVADKIAVRIAYAGCETVSTFPTKDETIEHLEAFEKAYKSRYPLLQVAELTAKLGKKVEKPAARKPPSQKPVQKAAA